MEEVLVTIGELARRGGVATRTVRFWSDQGLVPVARRSSKGYRLYGAEAIARLELVRTLRELGVGLDAIAAVLSRSVTPAEVASEHARALDSRIRTLRAQRAVLRIIARRQSTLEETAIMSSLARLSAPDRQKLLDDLVERAFDGVPDDHPSRRIAAAMRALPAELPDDPEAEALSAWLELGELAADPSFAARVREMALASVAPGSDGVPSLQTVLEHANDALARGVPPAEGRAIVDRIVPNTSRLERQAIASRLETFTDERVERYWELLGILHRRPPFPKHAPAFRWTIEALRAP